MFTGIIQTKGKVTAMEKSSDDLRLQFSLGDLRANEIKLGDSIAVNGVCLTAVEINLNDNNVMADVSKETLNVTLIGKLEINDEVNLELALCAGDHLGGHIVSGHVDGIAQLKAQYAEGDSTRLVFELNDALHSHHLGQFIATKGSVTIDGVSLTVNHVEDYTSGCSNGEGEINHNHTQFGINIVPHTRQETIIGSYQVGQMVHVEIDMLARYMQRQLAFASQFKSS